MSIALLEEGSVLLLCQCGDSPEISQKGTILSQSEHSPLGIEHVIQRHQVTQDECITVNGSTQFDHTYI
jgi:hypothetical protein